MHKLVFESQTGQLWHGHAIDVVNRLPPRHVQCVITSPPYWKLRKYSGNQDVVWPKVTVAEPNGQSSQADEVSHIACNHKWHQVNGTSYKQCSVCGCYMGALGQEPIPDCGFWGALEYCYSLGHDLPVQWHPCNLCYICHSIAVLRAIRRVLKDDGIVFWVIGDTFWTNKVDAGRKERGLPHKGLCLIPQRLAHAVAVDGWHVCMWVVWSKQAYIQATHDTIGNALPSPARNRPNMTSEYILMLTKSPKYFYDRKSIGLKARSILNTMREGDRRNEDRLLRHSRKLTKHDVAVGRVGKGYSYTDPLHTKPVSPEGKAIPNVWVINTQPTSYPHCAPFPEALAWIAIKLATSDIGECPVCGKAWKRVTSAGRIGEGDNVTSPHAINIGGDVFLPQCHCGDDPIPQIVLDPFVGAGTTAIVAQRLGRRWIGIDISEEYCQIAVRRLRNEPVPFKIQLLSRPGK